MISQTFEFKTTFYIRKSYLVNEFVNVSVEFFNFFIIFPVIIGTALLSICTRMFFLQGFGSGLYMKFEVDGLLWTIQE